MALDDSLRTAASNQQRRYFTHEELSSTKFRLARFLVRYQGRLSLCDANNIHQMIKYKWQTCNFFGLRHRHCRPIDRSARIERLWPLFVFAFYLVLTLKLSILLVLQFYYDSSKTKLDLLRASTNATGRSICDSLQLDDSASLECQLEREYAFQMESSYATMKLLGNPYVHNIWTLQAAIVAGLCTTWLSYFMPQILVNYGPALRMFLYDLLLDDKLEFSHLEAKIHSELRQLECSSWNLVRKTIELTNEGLRHTSYENLEQVNQSQLNNLSNDCSVNIFLRDRVLIRHQLRRLRFNSQLHPINRNSAQWRSTIVDKFVRANMTNLIYSFVLDWTIIYFIHLVSPIKLEFVTWSDRLLPLEVWLYFQVGVFATNYHLTTFMIHCENQHLYINHLISRLAQMMATNEREFAQMLASTSTSSFESQYKLMNGRLVEVLLEYRIFLNQLTDFIQAWKSATLAGLMVFFFSPLIACLYSPYVVVDGFKTLGTLFSINTSVFADFILAPICSFESQGHQLYRALASLLAHAIELEQQSRDHFQGRGIYMKLLIDMLRKELNHPDQVLAHFTTRITGFTATFPKLIEIHFYLSVLNLALYIKIDAWRTLLGNRLDDPLQVFQ